MGKTTVNWNEKLYERFCTVGMLCDFDRDVLRMRIMQYTISEIAQAKDCDESTVSRSVARLRGIYDGLQPYYADELPPRKSSKIEDYMDTH